MLAHCRNNPTTPECIYWSKVSPVHSITANLDYCKYNAGTEYCKNWCNNAPGGTCDTIVSDWCRRFPNDPYCSCINSKLNDPKFRQVNPVCIDSTCMQRGFKTKSHRDTACPAVTSCDIIYDAVNAGVNVINSTSIIQNCNNSTGAGAGVGTGTGTGTDDDIILFVFAFIMFIIFMMMLGLGIYLFMAGDADDADDTNTNTRDD